MIIKSRTYSPLLIKYPILRWVSAIINFPFFIAIYLIFPTIIFMFLITDPGSYYWLLVFFMILFFHFIIYINLRRGWGALQTIELTGDILKVTTKTFPFKIKRQHKILQIEIEDLEAWNMLTGRPIKLSDRYARLVINETKLFHLYKKNELENLILKFETEAYNARM